MTEQLSDQHTSSSSSKQERNIKSPQCVLTCLLLHKPARRQLQVRPISPSTTPKNSHHRLNHTLRGFTYIWYTVGFIIFVLFLHGWEFHSSYPLTYIFPPIRPPPHWLQTIKSIILYHISHSPFSICSWHWRIWFGVNRGEIGTRGQKLRNRFID